MAKASEWATRVAAWRASGKKAADFCQEHGYSRQSLHWWSSHIGRNGSIAKSEQPVRLARVVRMRAEASSMRPTIVVHVGRARVEVAAGVDQAVLRAVFDALGSAPKADGR